MRRREFLSMLGGAFLVRPLAAAAQPPWRVAILSATLPALESIRSLTLPELASEGFVEDQNLALEIRLGNAGDLPRLAHELLSTEPSVLIAAGDDAIGAARAAGGTTAIVGAFIGEDPVAAGFAQSLERPGGMVTGILMLAPELEARRLALLHEAIPRASRLGALAVSAERDAPSLTAMAAQARQMSVELRRFYAATPDDLPRAFDAIKANGVEALSVTAAPELARHAEGIAGLALAAKMPTMCQWPWMAQRGCLMGYGPVSADLYRRTASYVGRILRGAQAGDLPIERPTQFGFALNAKTASALEVDISPALLARATEVIE